MEANQCEAVKLNCAHSCDGCKTSLTTSKDTTKLTPPTFTSTTLQERTSGHSDESSTRTTLDGNRISKYLSSESREYFQNLETIIV